MFWKLWIVVDAVQVRTRRFLSRRNHPRSSIRFNGSQGSVPRRTGKKVVAILAAGAMNVAPSFAAGHGPVFGLTTPTLGRGGWSLDLSWMGRSGSEGSRSMARGMLSYGATEDLMVSFSAPINLQSAPLPAGRITSMMPANRDLEAMVAWRFQRRGVDVGARQESTAYFSFLRPTGTVPRLDGPDLRTAPGFYTGAATGYASRGHYLWGGAGYQRYGSNDGDRQSDTLFYSFVWGWRPPPLQLDYPKPDWRIFVEMTGEQIGRVRRAGMDLVNSGGHQVFVGPTALGIYRNIAIEGGILVPLYRNLNGNQPRERFRVAIDLSYFF